MMLCYEAAGLPELPLCPEKSHLVPSCHEGMSLVPLMKNPREPWKQAAFSQFPRPGDYMGYSLRTPRYRYTEWVKFIGQPFYRPVWRNQVGVELYDHSIDPEENINRARERNYTAIRTQLSQTLQAGWRSVMPRQRPQAQVVIHGKQKTLNAKSKFHLWRNK
jgi:iduronate 2-sulfatase